MQHWHSLSWWSAIWLRLDCTGSHVAEVTQKSAHIYLGHTTSRLRRHHRLKISLSPPIPGKHIFALAHTRRHVVVTQVSKPDGSQVGPTLPCYTFFFGLTGTLSNLWHWHRTQPWITLRRTQPEPWRFNGSPLHKGVCIMTMNAADSTAREFSEIKDCAWMSRSHSLLHFQ